MAECPSHVLGSGVLEGMGAQEGSEPLMREKARRVEKRKERKGEQRKEDKRKVR